MWVPSSADSRQSRSLRSPVRRPPAARRRRARPGLEILGDRFLLSSFAAPVPISASIGPQPSRSHQEDETVKLFVLGPRDAPMIAGREGQFTIIKESSGKADAGDSDLITLTSGDGQTVFPDRPFKLRKGRFTVHVALDKADSTTLIASEGSVAGTSRSFTVYAAAADSLSLSVPSVVTSGDGFPVTVTAYDRYGNIATGYQGTVTLTSSDGQAVSPNTVSFSSSSTTPGVATVTATLDQAGTTKLTATAGWLKATSNKIVIQPAAAASITVSVPSTVTAGVPSNATITPKYAFAHTTDGIGNPTSTDGQSPVSGQGRDALTGSHVSLMDRSSPGHRVRPPAGLFTRSPVFQGMRLATPAPARGQ